MEQVKREYICDCKYVRNYFIANFKLHATFVNESQFLSEYKHILQSHSGTDEEIAVVLNELHHEYERRKSHHKMSLERAQLVKEKYKPLFPEIYCFKESFLAPEFVQIASIARKEGTSKADLLKTIKVEKASQVYSFEVFNSEFAAMLIEELENFECSEVPKGRPNTMNNYGINLKELGLDTALINPLRADYLAPIAKLLYPEWVGSGLDSQRSFIVTYKIGQDIDLSNHYDNAEVTLNVSLGKNFSGGELCIGDMRHDINVKNGNYYPCFHKPTYGVLHRGQQMHGAMPIQDGERFNLIIWMRASSIRNEQCPMCDKRPNLVEVPFDGDGFTQPDVNVCVAL